MKTRLGKTLAVLAFSLLASTQDVRAEETEVDAPQSQAREMARESSRAASDEAIARLRAATRIKLPAPQPKPRASVSGD